jgi:hypothetical protein
VLSAVIVPFHRNLDQWQACLPAIRRSLPAAALVAVCPATSDC